MKVAGRGREGVWADRVVWEEKQVGGAGGGRDLEELGERCAC